MEGAAEQRITVALAPPKIFYISFFGWPWGGPTYGFVQDIGGKHIDGRSTDLLPE
jgi:hypothetical protein